MRYAMIMAGGAGSRLWPMSRAARPKQLLPFIGSDRMTLLGLAASRRDEPEAVFAVLTADHVIEKLDEFRTKLDVGFRLVEDDPSRFVTFGITPTEAETKYGYVELGDRIAGYDDAYVCRKFTEKPVAETAQQYVDSGRYKWNSGMFVFHAGRFTETLATFAPASYAGLARIGDAWATDDRDAVLAREYPELPKISVDYAVMEPASSSSEITVCTVSMDIDWIDVGSWPSFGQTLEETGGNRVLGTGIFRNARNILAVSDDPDHVIVAIGVEDLVIVRTEDVTLVCRADCAEDVKKLVEEQVEEGLK